MGSVDHGFVWRRSIAETMEMEEESSERHRWGIQRGNICPEISRPYFGIAMSKMYNRTSLIRHLRDFILIFLLLRHRRLANADT
jgi:hypothetical protein